MNEDIEIYYYSFITNNNLIVKLDITIFENFTYLMNIIAKEKYNYKKLKFKYVLTEFQYLLNYLFFLLYGIYILFFLVFKYFF
jgi:hypothetical protein